MKKILIVTVLSVIALLQGAQFQANAQFARNNAESISASIDAPGTLIRTFEKVYLDGRKLTVDEIRNEMAADEFAKYKTGYGLYKGGMVVSTIGAIACGAGFIGNCIYFAEGSADQRIERYSLYAVAGGFGMIFLALPFEMAGLVKMDKAVDLHNERGKKVSFEPASSGIGLRMRF